MPYWNRGMFVKFPSLPSNKLEKVIIGEEYAEQLRPLLLNYGISVLTCPKNNLLDRRLSSHVDLSVLHLGGKRFCVSKAVAIPSFVSELSEMGAEIDLRSEPRGSTYPDDSKLCACLIGGNVYHNSSASILKATSGFINVRQGYAKCATCVVTGNAAITSDNGIAKAMHSQGIEVLLISPGYIRLEGYESGFIGGSTFKLSQDTLAFTGSLYTHPDKDRIERFLLSHGVKHIYLSETKIFDIGSAIPLIESD